MKKLLTYFFCTLGIIFFLILCGLAYLWYADPFEIRPVIEGFTSRRRSAKDVVDEIERVIDRVGPRAFEFVDSTFNVPAGHAEGICREILRRRLSVKLTAMGVNPLGVTRELFALMRSAGFNAMMITPEAASDVMLRSLRKGFTVEHHAGSSPAPKRATKATRSRSR